MNKCKICGLEFEEERRLKIHFNTHMKKERNGKKTKNSGMPDFDKPDFSQVM